MTTTKQQQKRGKNHIWIIPFILIIILIIGAGGFYVYSYFGQQREQQESQQSQNQSQQQSQEQSQQQSSLEASAVQAELAAMRQVLEQDVFYAGLFIDDLELSGKTYDEVKAIMQKLDQQWQAGFSEVLKLEANTWQLTAAKAGLKSDWQAVLDQAWQTGRTSGQADEEAQLRERYKAVTDLKTNPLHLTVTRTYNAEMVRSQILSYAESLKIEPVGAVATGFDRQSKKFIIEEQKPGRTIDGEAWAAAVLKLLDAGKYGQTVTPAVQVTTTGMDAAAMQSKLGYVSQGITYAEAVNKNRDHNITLICQRLNQVLLQPGESFSFNGYIGQRTAEKGFREAGGIINGILTDTLGGGICQPNTTLCQAVLMADLQIDERHPHSWPSSYTEVGLDATVSWKGPDFKFTNNTEYPLAVVAWYDKPSVVVRIYGRLLEEGVTISLDTVHNGYIDVNPPTETFNPDLLPGERVEIRAEHRGQRATAYKVWKKDGKVIKREEAFKSYYRPLNAIYEFGPPLPTPTPTPTPTPLVPTKPAPKPVKPTPTPTAA